MRWFTPFALAATLAFATSALADLSPGQKQAVEALIKDFSSKEWTFANDRSGLRLAVRQKVVDRLIEIGPDAAPLVRKALAVPVPAQDAAGAKPLEPEKISFDASRVTVSVKDERLIDVLRMFAEKSGNSPIRLSDVYDDMPVTLTLKDAPYWQALDRLWESVGLVWEPDVSSSRMVTKPWNERPEARVCVGPVLVTARHAPQGEELKEFARYRIDYYWEDRLPVAAAELLVTGASTPDGRELRVHGDGKDEWSGGHAFAGTGEAIFVVPEGVAKKALPRGVLRLHVASEKTELTLQSDLVLGLKEQSANGDGLVLTATGVDTLPNSVWVKLALRREDGGRAYFAAIGDPRYGFRLVGPDGNRHEPTDVLFGEASVSACPHGGWFAAGTPDPSARTVGFKVVPRFGEKWSLVCVCPAKDVVKEFPFDFRDVPVQRGEGAPKEKKP